MFGRSQSEKRLKDLEETVERHGKTLRDLELEWDATYEKFRQLYMRISKRVKREEELRENAEEPQPEGLSEVSTQRAATDGGPTGFLTARQKAIQQTILRRRNGR